MEDKHKSDKHESKKGTKKEIELERQAEFAIEHARDEYIRFKQEECEEEE